MVKLARFRPSQWIHWVELFFGAILPTIFVVPFLAVVAGLGVLYSAYVNLGLFISGLGIGAIFSMWTLILFGPEMIQRNAPLRVFVLFTGIPGFFLCLFLLYYFATSVLEWGALMKPISFDWRTIEQAQDWRLILLGLVSQFLVGLRYLPALFGKGGKG